MIDAHARALSCEPLNPIDLVRFLPSNYPHDAGASMPKHSQRVRGISVPLALPWNAAAWGAI
jgi:hypothetical protein